MEVEPDRDDAPCIRAKGPLEREGIQTVADGKGGCDSWESTSSTTEARECATSTASSLIDSESEVRFLAPPLLLLPSLDDGSECELSAAVDGVDSLSPSITDGTSELFEDDLYDETRLLPSFTAITKQDASCTTEASDVQASKHDMDENFMTEFTGTNNTGGDSCTENDTQRSTTLPNIPQDSQDTSKAIWNRAIGSSPVLKLRRALSFPRRSDLSTKLDSNKICFQNPMMLGKTTTFVDPFPTPTRKGADSFDYEDAFLFETPKRRFSFSSLVTESTMESDSESTSTEFTGQSNSNEAVMRRRSLSHVNSGGLASRSAEDVLLNSQNQALDGRPLRRIRLDSSSLRRSFQKTRKRIRRLRQRRREQPTSWLIPAEHPVKVGWDVCTVILSMISAYLTHTSIRDRDYDKDRFLIRFCEIWFLVDILLNFVTQHRSGRTVLFSVQSVWARYLTTWFIIDVISFLPWERLWVKPIVEMQKRRSIVQKTKRRSKVVFKITRMLRGRHIKWFRHVTRHTKCAGVGSRRLLGLIIKYIPKYFTFCKNMRTVLAVRLLRQVHWVRKVVMNRYWKLKVGEVEDEKNNDNVLEEVEEEEEEEVEDEEEDEEDEEEDEDEEDEVGDEDEEEDGFDGI